MDGKGVKVAENLSELGPVSQKSRDFSGLIPVSQFPLYLCNAEVLNHQTSNPLAFPYIKIMLQDQLF